MNVWLIVGSSDSGGVFRDRSSGTTGARDRHKQKSPRALTLSPSLEGHLKSADHAQQGWLRLCGPGAGACAIRSPILLTPPVADGTRTRCYRCAPLCMARGFQITRVPAMNWLCLVLGQREGGEGEGVPQAASWIPGLLHAIRRVGWCDTWEDNHA